MTRFTLFSRIAALGLVLVASVAASPAIAQTAQEEALFQQALRRFQNETSLFQQAFNRYQQARANRSTYRDPRYRDQRYDQSYDDRDENGYDPARYYRDGNNYQERELAADDRVYRGSDGRYYCKRNDGTTGLIIGAVGGGILGNIIDGGHSRAVGTILGGVLGAVAGKAIDQGSSEKLRCR